MRDSFLPKCNFIRQIYHIYGEDKKLNFLINAMKTVNITAKEKIEFEQSATKHITRRLMLFLICLFIVAFTDRANVGYAALEITKVWDLTLRLPVSARAFSFSVIVFSRFRDRGWLKTGGRESDWRESFFHRDFRQS